MHVLAAGIELHIGDELVVQARVQFFHLQRHSRRIIAPEVLDPAAKNKPPNQDHVRQEEDKPDFAGKVECPVDDEIGKQQADQAGDKFCRAAQCRRLARASRRFRACARSSPVCRQC